MSSVSAGAAQARQIQKVYSEWCVKAAEIILASRIDDSGKPDSATQNSASFNLTVPELFDVRSEVVARPEFFQLKTQRSFQIEIYLGAQTDATSIVEEAEVGELLERWTFTFFPAAEPNGADRCNQTLVRKLSVTLRSLMCFTRLLPAYSFCRNAGSARQWRCRVEAWPPTSRATSAQELSTQDFVSLQSSVGSLRLSVSQRKDLKSVPANGGLLHSSAAIGSQLEGFDVEEGYFAATADVHPSTDSAAPLGKLDKIAEEPEGRASDRRGGQLDAHHADRSEQPSLSSTPSTAVHEPTRERSSRPRLSSEESTTSTMSTSSRAYSMPEQAVVLGATPPLAAWPTGTSPPQGLITLGPHHGKESACSSRSNTPHTTPKLGPAPAPNSRGSNTPHTTPKLGPAPAPNTAGAGVTTTERLRASSSGSTGGGVSSIASASAAAENRGIASGTADQSYGRVAPAFTPPRPGEFDDLSGIWMSCPPEWSHRRSTSLGGASRGSGYSRSVSPEDPTRRSNLAAAAAAANEGLGLSCGASASTGGSSRATPNGTRSGRAAFPPPPEPEGEICMFGMSDDEEDLPSDDEEDERNVVASTIREGGGGAFAATSIDLKRLGMGIAGLDIFDQSSTQRRPSIGSDGASGSTPRTKLSPLIAQLNPFTPPQNLDPLPPSAWDYGTGMGETGFTPRGHEGPMSSAAGLPSEQSGFPEEGNSEGNPDVRHLLVEMGELVCMLQQKRELAITSQEVMPEDLLDRLAHFKELANSKELQCHA